MGFFDLFRPRPARTADQIVRDLAEASFTLHPSALDRVVIRVDTHFAVVEMEVPALDPQRDVGFHGDPAQQTARISALLAELARSGSRPVQSAEITILRDRVIWMPSVMPVRPPLE